jgi:calcium/calmodulin-dependent protein kinase I
VGDNNRSQVKIIDFGFAKILDHTSMATSTLCGTPLYVSPEILTAKSLEKAYGTSVDVWGVGVITFVLLGGYPPFLAKDKAMLYRKITSADYSFHDEFWADVSADARDFIDRLLVVEPSKRLTAAQALQHVWIRSDAAQAQALGRTLESAQRRLEAALQSGSLSSMTSFGPSYYSSRTWTATTSSISPFHPSAYFSFTTPTTSTITSTSLLTTAPPPTAASTGVPQAAESNTG